jgi:cytochrome c-type biogenesis protein CcmF
MLGAIADLWYRGNFGKLPVMTSFARLKGLPRSAWGTAFAHFGLGVTVVGIVAASAFSTEHVVEMNQGQTADAGGYSLTFDGFREAVGPNFTEERGHFSVSSGGAVVSDVWSSKRLYTARRMPTTEAGILTFGLSQLYVSLGDPMDGGGIVVRIWWKPLILCIWGGCLIMMVGGFVSLSDRRLRVGAPSRKAKPVKVVMEPAE